MYQTLRQSIMQTGRTITDIRTGVLLIAFLAGCSMQSSTDSQPPVPQVYVTTVTTRTIVEEPEFIGQTESFRPVEIRSQVNGIIKKIFFTEGRNIKKGDKLYLIDPVPFNAVYKNSRAMVTQARARLDQANKDLARVQPLLKQKAVSKKEVDDAVVEVRSARAALEAAQNVMIKAKFDLDNTLITAPVEGRINRSQFYEGRLVEAQTNLLTTIDQLDPMYVNVNIPESYLLRLRRELSEHKLERPESIFQLSGVMTFSDGSIYPEEGLLDFEDIVIRPETGMLLGRFVFSNPAGKNAPGEAHLYPGQFVKVRIKGYSRTGAILIPQRAVQQQPSGSFVYVINEGKAELRPVQASAWQGNEWLIESGLQAGEQVVVEGIHRIHPGVQVNPVPYQQEESQTS
ncbi:MULTISPECIES: efflux RND transporter periplasmic adaptor subunit [Nitrosomonas]|uniref:HlyD family secretion protein n=1 Tax=Nitrosomonas europaea (strain ATCC 19718 / CIP 103999 / KCTC 2705 / NBRC 14298) TaxID=228410 RepID=Q82XT3_NITEU|nr:MULTISPECIES: efflux RND transporter periplasmic adaptor subunit [Nitrosomonas]CAD84080.1 HlyD family secretion protein [Nitrosomonas europaea ATCC 19718]SDW80780.1 membrane fusion protein, multidrug efflux system [Nitrosomonas europaea]SET34888.1 membrane fusion protein, multidrug efflux system [Nitrosomonas europaea]SJZ88905.1 membrane fusion protein, multidrug efflux system [Nitrosomonas europaea]HBF25883.1 efflux RND transporter periplasmic adaptor subunit [Nitrosomonas sp.]